MEEILVNIGGNIGRTYLHQLLIDMVSIGKYSIFCHGFMQDFFNSITTHVSSEFLLLVD